MDDQQLINAYVSLDKDDAEAVTEWCFDCGLCPCGFGSSIESILDLDKVSRKVLTAALPYTRWSDKDLKTCADQRHITITPRLSVVQHLRQADSELRFPLMKLPQELRLCIYDKALQVDLEKEVVSSRSGKPNNKPALLQTCRDIHRVGTPMFYRLNTFNLVSDSPLSETNMFNSVTEQWLIKIGSDNLGKLRHLIIAVFRDRGGFNLRVKIDLQSQDPQDWILYYSSPDDHRTDCDECRRGAFTLKETCKFFQTNSEEKEKVLEVIEETRVAIAEFHEKCGRGASLKTTRQGLQVLLDAVLHIWSQLSKFDSVHEEEG